MPCFPVVHPLLSPLSPLLAGISLLRDRGGIRRLNERDEDPDPPFVGAWVGSTRGGCLPPGLPQHAAARGQNGGGPRVLAPGFPLPLPLSVHRPEIPEVRNACPSPPCNSLYMLWHCVQTLSVDQTWAGARATTTARAGDVPRRLTCLFFP